MLVTLKKIQNLLFYLLIIFLPMQLGKHFWPEFSFVSGVRVDYFSPTFYLTDLLVLAIFLLELLKSRKISKNILFIAVFFVIFAFFNIYASLSPILSIYKWLKVLEIGFLVWFVAKNRVDLGKTSLLLLIPVFYESLLVISQFIYQASVNGLWFYLGERTFNSSTVGIANTIINGQLLLRPYGTFSHPNVLGGFLAVCLPLIIYYFPHKYRKITAVILGFGLSALFLSMSRAAIGVGLVGLVVSLGLRFNFKQVWGMVLVLVLFAFVVLSLQTEVLPIREEFNIAAVNTFLHSPVTGAGLGTSPLFTTVKNFSLINQPTHNIFLMALGETGIVGFLVIVLVIGLALIKTVKNRNFVLTTSLLSICLLGMVDHYFFTLQQGQLLFALILGLSFAKIEE